MIFKNYLIINLIHVRTSMFGVLRRNCQQALSHDPPKIQDQLKHITEGTAKTEILHVGLY